MSETMIMIDIAALHDVLTVRWHQEALETWQPSADVLTSLVGRQHLANFELWHTEDAARIPGISDTDLARVKRRIDETNQRRNDLSEELDRALLQILEKHGLPDTRAELHSESPGLIIDRLSILALKVFHTREEIARPDAAPGHGDRNQERLLILLEQRSDLARCLERLWAETMAGTRRFKLYRQLKMYNDPTLNPSVYHNHRIPSGF